MFKCKICLLECENRGILMNHYRVDHKDEEEPIKTKEQVNRILLKYTIWKSKYKSKLIGD